MSTTCNIRPFLEVVERFPEDPRVIRPFPDLPRLVEEARQALAWAETQPLMFDRRDTARQGFKLPVYLEGGGCYEAIWAVAAAERLIRESGLTPVTLRLKDLLANISPETVDPRRLPFVNGDASPVLVAEFQLLEWPLVVIDGNHRVIDRLRRGMEVTQAYLLPPALHMQAMAGPLPQTCYAIHWNFTEVFNYMLGQLAEVELLPYPVSG